MTDETAPDDELCFKLILVGDSGVGKSALTFRFCDNVFFEDGAPTLGVDFKYTRIFTAEPTPRVARLQVWDTAGQDTFLTLTTSFYRASSGVLLCFDLTNRLSFMNLDKWIERIRECTDKTPAIVLIGCKVDLAQNPHSLANGSAGMNMRQVSEYEADAWCRRNGALCYFETSAKESKNILEAFRSITTHIAKETRELHKNPEPRSEKRVNMKPRRNSAVKNESKKCC